MGGAVSSKLKDGTTGYRQAGSVAQKALADDEELKKVPDVVKFLQHFAKDLSLILTKSDARRQKLDELVAAREHVSPKQMEFFVNTLRKVAQRFTDYAGKLDVEGLRLPAGGRQ